ncbi:MAG: MFS transporter, partial [Actinomycetota bacterium]
ITLAGTIGPTLTSKQTLGMSESQVGLTATAYLAGAVLGSLVFGYMTDRWGRKKLFMVTLRSTWCSPARRRSPGTCRASSCSAS